MPVANEYLVYHTKTLLGKIFGNPRIFGKKKKSASFLGQGFMVSFIEFCTYLVTSFGVKSLCRLLTSIWFTIRKLSGKDFRNPRIFSLRKTSNFSKKKKTCKFFLGRGSLVSFIEFCTYLVTSFGVKSLCRLLTSIWFTIRKLSGKNFGNF